MGCLLAAEKDSSHSPTRSSKLIHDNESRVAFFRHSFYCNDPCKHRDMLSFLLLSVNFGQNFFMMELSALLPHQNGLTQEPFFLKRSKLKQENEAFCMFHSPAAHPMPKSSVNSAKFAVLCFSRFKTTPGQLLDIPVTGSSRVVIDSQDRHIANKIVEMCGRDQSPFKKKQCMLVLEHNAKWTPRKASSFTGTLTTLFYLTTTKLVVRDGYPWYWWWLERIQEMTHPSYGVPQVVREQRKNAQERFICKGLRMIVLELHGILTIWILPLL